MSTVRVAIPVHLQNLARVAGDYLPLADHDGVPARLSFVTTHQPEG